MTICFSLNPAYTQTATNTIVAQTTTSTTIAEGDWPGYNRTLTSERFSPLNQISTENVANLKQVCAFDLGEGGNFQSGIIVVNNTLYITTDANTFAIDPATCLRLIAIRRRWQLPVARAGSEEK